MKRVFAGVLLCALLLCACGKEQELPALETFMGDGYVAIVWEGRTYVPFCVVSKEDCAEPFGCIRGDQECIVCIYKDYAPEEWIANYLTTEGSAILFKEVGVTQIPDGLESEYEWNQK